jgi:hypothetical protein
VSQNRPQRLTSGPLSYAPQNELGVVFLFATMAKGFGIRVETIRHGFPDCIAYKRTGSGEKRVRIEFEYRSSSFKRHGHSASKCDWIVCWKHDWTDAPRNLRIIELRRELGLGFNVWIVPLAPEFDPEYRIRKGDRIWSAPSQANEGDLVLWYISGEVGAITSIYRYVERAYKDRAQWRGRGTDYFAEVRRVCSLKSPLFFQDMKTDRYLRTSNFIRANMRGRPNVLEYWPYLYRKIVRRNPSVERRLKKYKPEKL